VRVGVKRALAVVLLVFSVSGSVAWAVVVQGGGVRVTVMSQVKPYKLPRKTPVPIADFVAGHLAAVGGGIPPQLRRLRIEVNRHGLLQSRGLPVCRPAEVQPATTSQALRACGPALIGSGRFWAHIVLPEQGAYATQGRLLIFNGRRRGKPTLLAQIYTSHPFDSSFLVDFAIRRIDRGPYGTELTASLPETLGRWGYLDRIKLNLRREYIFKGRRLSYFNASCPALSGAKRTSFALAHVSFEFAEAKVIAGSVQKTCGVRE
jgi:hypothetical protein